MKESTPNRPLVSVLTVVYNGERYLEQALTSVLGQSYDNVEYLIMDGGSTDRTLDIIKKYGDRIEYWRSEPDTGIYDAMNKGLRLARGELIGLLNADDFYEPDAVEAAVKAYLAGNRGPGIYYGHTFVLQEDLGLRYRWHASREFWRGMSISHQAMFIHRQVYDQLGPYDRQYGIAADYDFVLRAVRAGVPFVAIDRFVVHYRNIGLSADNMKTSLTEARHVNREHFAPFSPERIKFDLLFCKSMLILALQKIIAVCLGGNILARVRRFYFRKFIAKGNEF